jgi:hypothetical protein
MSKAKFDGFWRRMSIPEMNKLQQWHIDLIKSLVKQAYLAGIKEGKKQSEQ